MGNYRTKMRQCGRLDVTVNGGKRGRHSTSIDPPNKDIKKPRKGEINFLPDYPEGMEEHNLEGSRQVLVNEMMKKKPNGSLVNKEMDMTFALRRKEVVQDKPAISQMVHRWPALFTESQVCMQVLIFIINVLMCVSTVMLTIKYCVNHVFVEGVRYGNLTRC